MRLLTQDAVLLCGHNLGRVGIVASQGLVTIAARAVLVEPDPKTRPITGCPPAPGFKPCQTTLTVSAGYSGLLRIKTRDEGRKRVCLSTVLGLTDGTPPRSVIYYVSDPGQGLVSEVG